jgi:hypothetical protein
MPSRRATLLLALSMFGVCAVSPPRTWSFRDALAPPSQSEIKSYDDARRAKKARIGAIEAIAQHSLTLSGMSYDVTAFRYALNGSPRCGMVLLPKTRPARVPLLIDVPDVRWDYPARDISGGLFITRILGAHAGEVALALPCLRGNTLQTRTLALTAGGSRSDAWDGAADDVVAFLTVVRRRVGDIDGRRVAVYGSSRGGGVALLAAQRDRRIRAVLALAPPTDWFSGMGRPGTDWASALESAWAGPAPEPDSREAQFFDWFFRDAQTLGHVRRRLLGASPAFFVAKLPPTLVLQGAEDSAVPPRNAMQLRDMAITNASARHLTVRIIPGEGHVIRGEAALREGAGFLKTWLGLTRPEHARKD